MSIRLAYGRTGLRLDLDPAWDVTVAEPRDIPSLLDPQAAIRGALRAPLESRPLRAQMQPGMKVGVVFSDITRPTPNALMLPVVLEELEAAGVAREDIVLFNALGTHRANTEAELRYMLGETLLGNYRLVQNDAFDQRTQVYLGQTARGHPVWLNRELMACDMKVLTGFIEPHFFAGFSGGGKALMPGMAGQQTVLGNHDAGMIAHPQATWGVTHGNPIWEEVHEVAQKAGRLFLLNLALNNDKRVTQVFAGELAAAHNAGCAFVKQTAMVPVAQPFDIVITTNSGYPLDQNLYQSVKGMSAAAQVVKKGGAILIAAECCDGLPEHGLYSQLLREARNPRELLERVSAPGFLKQDQWQVQIQAQIQLKAEVYVYSGYLTDDQVLGALLLPCPRIETTMRALLERHGPQAKICVLPQGPQTIPYVSAC